MRTKKSRPRGEFAFSIEEAGAMIGLGRNSAYEAARKGDIPTIRIGRLWIVPKAAWLQKLAQDGHKQETAVNEIERLRAENKRLYELLHEIETLAARSRRKTKPSES